MIKVAIDARMINTSGIGTYLRNMIPNLSDEFQLSLLGNSEKLVNFSEKENVNIIEANSSIYSIKEQVELTFKVPGCDVFISPHYNIPILPVKSKKRITVIHDVYHLAYYKSLSLSQKMYASFMIKSAIKRSVKIITVSEFSKSEIIKYTECNPDKIKVIYCGINDKNFQKNYSEDLFAKIKQKFNLPKNYFLFVGNIKPHKNLKNLLLAFEIFLKKNPDYKLVVVGRKEGLITQDFEVFDIVEKNEHLKQNVIFTGYNNNNEMAGIYKLASALVFPSFYEGFGLPSLEAMICNCPVISSNSASLPEACGEAALFFDPNNPKELSEKMDRLIYDQDLRNQLIQKGIENYKRFNWEKFSKELSQTIREVVGR